MAEKKTKVAATKVAPKKAPGKVSGKKLVTAEEKFQQLAEITSQPKYLNQKYKADTEITIKGVLFADFVNTQANTQDLLFQVHRNLKASLDVIESLMNASDMMTLSLMEQHVKNVDNGATETVPEEEIPTETQK